MILTGLRLNHFFKKYELWNMKPKVEIYFEKTLKIALKLPKSPYFFHFLGKIFLKSKLGLKKSFLNQTTYVLKNRLYPQSFLNQDSFLNQAFLNRDSTVTRVAALDYINNQ